MKKRKELVFALAMAIMLSACGGCVAREAASPTEIPSATATLVSTAAPAAAPSEPAAPSTSGNDASSMTAERAVSLAERCVENKDDASAVQFYTYAISQQPDDAALYMARGECFTRIATPKASEDGSSDVDTASDPSLFSPVVMDPDIREILYAQKDYQKAAELGSEEAKSKLEELRRDRTVLRDYWYVYDSPNGSFFEYYGYNEYGSLTKTSSAQEGTSDAFIIDSYSTEPELSELEAKAAKIEAGPSAKPAAQEKRTLDAQGRCMQVDFPDGTRVTYIYNENGQQEFLTAYDSDGNCMGNTKFVYNADGTLATKISDSYEETFADELYRYRQYITQYEYAMLSEVQSSDDIWPDRDKTLEMIENNTTEALSNLAVLPGTTPPQTVLPYTERPGWTTTAEHGLVLRAAPDTNAEKLTTIPLDSQILEIGKTDSATGWVFTWYRGQYGWVSAQYLKGGEIFVPEWR